MKIWACVIWTSLMDIWFFSSIRKIFLCFVPWNFLSKLISRYMDFNFNKLYCLPLELKGLCYFCSWVSLCRIWSGWMFNVNYRNKKGISSHKRVIADFPFLILLYPESVTHAPTCTVCDVQPIWIRCNNLMKIKISSEEYNQNRKFILLSCSALGKCLIRY